MVPQDSSERGTNPDWDRACLVAARERREHRLGELAGRRRLGGARVEPVQQDADVIVATTPTRGPKPSLGRPRL